MKEKKHYENPDDPTDQYEVGYSHQTAYNIRNKSLTRESTFTNKKLKYTHANSTEELNITIFLKESERFDLSSLNDEKAIDIVNRITIRRIIVQWPKIKYERMEEDARFDIMGYHINMYDCKYLFIPDDMYHTLLNDIKMPKFVG